MPAEEGGTGGCCICFISAFFFLVLLAGGVLLVLCTVLPESQATLWFPTAGTALVCIPWLFWTITCLYRSFAARKGRDDFDQPPFRASAVAPVTTNSD